MLLERGNLIRPVEKEASIPTLPDVDFEDESRFRLSPLAALMLEPEAGHFLSPLVGCDILTRQSTFSEIRHLIKRWMPSRGKLNDEPGVTPDVRVLFREGIDTDSYESSSGLSSFLDRFNTILHRTDPLFEKLKAVDPDSIRQVYALYRDLEGQIQQANIAGEPLDQMGFICDNLFKSIAISDVQGAGGRYCFLINLTEGHRDGTDYGLVATPSSRNEQDLFMFNGGALEQHLEKSSLLSILRSFDGALKLAPELSSVLQEAVDSRVNRLEIRCRVDSPRRVFRRTSLMDAVYRRIFEPIGVSRRRCKKFLTKQTGSVFEVRLRFCKPESGKERDIVQGTTIIQELEDRDWTQRFFPELSRASGLTGLGSALDRFLLLTHQRECLSGSQS